MKNSSLGRCSIARRNILEADMREAMPFRRSEVLFAWIILALIPLLGCSTYVTPGGGAKLADLSQTSWDIEKALARKPAAAFPARLAMVRVQASGYRSYGNQGYGTGKYSIVTTRDIEEEKDFDRIKNFPMV